MDAASPFVLATLANCHDMTATRSCVADDALWQQRRCNNSPGLAELPAELRFRIWSCAVEPRTVILDDLVHQDESYPLPPVTQLNAEARAETRQGFDPVGRGSYIDFDQDILVCGRNMLNHTSNSALEDLALRVRRLAFWDCFPDEGRIDGLNRYCAYLASSCPGDDYGKIELDKLWFPNLRHLWIIKVGDMHQSWMAGMDEDATDEEVRFRETARQFRYWVDADVIEVRPLDVSDAETKMILRNGRCARKDCQELSQGRQRTVSKVVFIDGKYSNRKETEVAEPWKRIQPWPADVGLTCAEARTTIANRMRWTMIEHALTCSLRSDDSDQLDDDDP